MAQTLKFGNGTWATKKGSTLAYSDTNNAFKPLPFTYTGAGKGTRVNKEGLIEVVENDRPRIDYLNSEDGVFILEKAATNLLTYSEDFSQWTNDRVTVSENQIISPNGTLNADLIAENSENNIHRIYIGSITLIDNVDYTITVFAKKGNSKVIQLTPTSTSAIGSGRANFDLENGVLGVVSGGTAEIKDYGNGWYRCSYSFEALATATSAISVNLVNDNLNAVRNVTYLGNINNNVYLWGGQTENGNTASSYIPTQGTIQTRVQETASGSGNSEVFNDSQGVLFADISALANDGTYRGISVSDGNISNWVLIYINNVSNQLRVNLASGGSVQANLVQNVTDVTIPNKVAIRYSLNNVSFWLNGIKVLEDLTTITMPVGLNKLSFDSTGTGLEKFYGKTKEIAYYDEVLTDLELETLTSYRTWEEMVKELNLNIIHNE